MTSPQRPIGSGFGFETQRSGVNPWAIDPEQARRLWTLSAELTGVDAFAS